VLHGEKFFGLVLVEAALLACGLCDWADHGGGDGKDNRPGWCPKQQRPLFHHHGSGYGLPLESLVKGGLLGILATLLTAGMARLGSGAVYRRARRCCVPVGRPCAYIDCLGGVGGFGTSALALLVFRLPGTSLIVVFGGTLLVVARLRRCFLQR